MKRRHHLGAILWLLPALAGVALHAHDAHACGGCFHPRPPPPPPPNLPPPPNPPPNEVDTVVTEHRMAFAMSTTQSVLWDQIRYSGNPKEFAWVLPVQPGTQVQLSTDAWLAALDANTETVIRPPPLPSCAPPPGSNGGGDSYGGYGGSYNGSSLGGGSDQSSSGGGGCGCAFGTSGERPLPPSANGGYQGGGNASSGGSAAAGSGASSGSSAGPPPPPPVTVQTRETVGPYDVVILRSSMGEALDAWLLANGFEIPPNIQPILDAYVAEKLDFVAMKLRPGANVNAMRPVRVVEPGADPNLPLRMISAGAGSHVGLTLWVISEGRYRPQNFPNAAIDFSQLVYDVAQGRSNYTGLRAAALSGGLIDAAADAGTDAETPRADAGVDAETEAATDAAPDAGVDAGADSATDAPTDVGAEAATDAGTEAGAPAGSGSWLTEYAGPVQPAWYRDPTGLTPGLLEAYAQACVPQTPPNPCDGGANDSGGDDGSPEAGGEGGASDGAIAADAPDDAAQDAGAGSSGDDGAASMANTGCTPPAPTFCDDPQVAFTGLHMGSIWITRLVADLPSSALGKDLVLEATPEQTQVANVHQAQSWVDGNPCTLGGSVGSLSATLRVGAPPAPATAATGGQDCALASKGGGGGAGACAILGMAALTLARARRSRRSRSRSRSRSS